MRRRIISLGCALMMLASVCSAAAASEAETRSSYYFSATDVRAYAEGGGEILIEIDIDATHTMLEVGASDVYIYEQQSSGSYKNVFTFTSDDYYDDMIETNTAFANLDLYYQGVSGRKYFATVAVYARDSEGAERRYYDTWIVTA